MIEIPKKYENSLNKINFIDLFCGIGGFRLSLESFGAKCIYSIDIDRHASKVYQKNFGNNPFGDITKVSAEEIPSHDILCAGFPCQTFSIAGKQKGFEDARGTLFFDIVRIVKYHQPKVLLLENVGNLKRHDNGHTFEIIYNTLNELGYNIYHDILNSSNYGISQTRRRMYIICIRRDIDNGNFHFPYEFQSDVVLKDILLDKKDCTDFIINKKFHFDKDKLQESENKFQRPYRVGTVNKGGQGDRIYSSNGHAITLSASSGGTGSKTGLYLIDNDVRKLHPRETARLMGFPDSFEYDTSINQAHKQFGNSVVINVLQYIIIELINDWSILGIKSSNLQKSTISKIIDNTKGSSIAKNGLKNEKDIVTKFDNWQIDHDSQEWLKKMGYNLDEIITVTAKTIYGYKTDVQISITTSNNETKAENIQIKLVSGLKGYNQIDKRWVESYAKLWNIPNNIQTLLKHYSGELKPYIGEVKDPRRMYMNEFTQDEQKLILDFFKDNQHTVLSDIFRGQGDYKAEWLLVVQRLNNKKWILLPIETVINVYDKKDVFITKKGNLNIGGVTMQRKGGDNGKITANKLQFKSNPSKLFGLSDN
jgi:DNA-cytosine methyltransferase